ncbi:MAG: cytochrome c peroxidase [Polyangiales bacterium]
MTNYLYRRHAHVLAGLAATALNACGTSDATGPSPAELGEQLFTQAFANTNRRSCATCHVPEDHFTLTPAHVARLLEKNPDDPLFSAIDADDPAAHPLTFEHLKKGLIRIWLTLPSNVDVIDEDGQVTTPADRRIFVWRSVPSIADAALTAPFQLDGRVATLEQQAQEAVTSHSEGANVAAQDLALIAAFEREQFSSERARRAAAEQATGTALGNASDVDATLTLSAEEMRGQAVYEAVCTACHGGTNRATIVDRAVHAVAFPDLKPDGAVRYTVPATDPPTLVLADQPNNEFINIGSAMENHLVQLEATEHESFTKDVSFPAYRLRFYASAARKEIVADLPPAVRPDEDPFNPSVDSDGNPIWGPNLFLQLFTTDPGRALITGSPYDFEAFDIPTLRGISRTAPYWHNNISETLEDVVELYSDHLLSKFPSLTLPGDKEPDLDGDVGPPEALTAAQKRDLVAYLKRL